jgi:Domain of unknown function (DUF1917)
MYRDLRKPSRVFDQPWIWAVYEEKDNTRSGKWMLFIPNGEIDRVWETIRYAVLKGLRGCSAKVATMMENKNAISKDHKLICIYVNDYTDLSDVGRVLAWLRRLGFTETIRFKTDQATLAGEYSKRNAGPVTLYTSPDNTYSFYHSVSKEFVYGIPTTETTCGYCENLITIPAPKGRMIFLIRFTQKRFSAANAESEALPGKTLSGDKRMMHFYVT